MTELDNEDQIPLTISVTPDQKERIDQIAERRRVSPEVVVLDALERELNEDAADKSRIEVEPGSFLDGLEDVVGSVEGPSDLSTNPEHMNGYGES